MNSVCDSEFAASVAAAAYAIYSVQGSEAESQIKIRKEFEKSRTELRTRNDNGSNGSVKVTRHSSSNAGGTSIRRPAEQDQRVQEISAVPMPSRKPSLSASFRPMISVDQMQKSNSTRSNAVENKVDSWERAQLRKINKRCENMKSEVLAWENAKKMKAKLRMERKKNELELRKSRNMQHYQIKVQKIEAIAGGARRQLEEKRRNEESELKEKVKHMRLKGKKPVRCFWC